MSASTDSELTISNIPAELRTRLERVASKNGQSLSEYVLDQAALAAAWEEEAEEKTLAAFHESLQRSARGEVRSPEEVFDRLRAKYRNKVD